MGQPALRRGRINLRPGAHRGDQRHLPLGWLCAILRRWAQLDGHAAFSYANSLDEGETKAQAMKAVASILA